MDLRVIPYLKTEILDSGENLASTSRENHLSKCIKQDDLHFDYSCIECYKISLALIKHQIESHRTNNADHRNHIFQTLKNIENAILFPSDFDPQLDYEIVTNVECRDTIKKEYQSTTGGADDIFGDEANSSTASVYSATPSKPTKTKVKCEICKAHFKTSKQLDGHTLKHHPVHHSIEHYSTYKKVLVFLDEKSKNVANVADKSTANDYYMDYQANDSNLLDMDYDGTDERPERFYCELCNRLYPSRKRLKIHQKIHSNSRPVFKCDMCEREYFDKETLRDHLYTHCGIKPYTCRYGECGQSFSHASGRRQHYKNHHSETPKNPNSMISESLACDICGRQYPNRKRLLIHLKTHGSNRSLFECTMCDRKYLDNATLRDHMNIHNGEKPYICAYGCGKGFAHASGRRHHHKAYHTSAKIKREDGGSGSILCDLCGREFVSKNRLLSHLKTHTKQRPIFKCTLCARTYIDKESHRDHMNTHTGERPFVCSFNCGKAFTHASIKRQHEKRHKPEERLMCEICSRLLKSKASYMDHIRTHTGEHPFSCDLCEKSFKSKKSLSKHRRMRHSDSRPFKCERCNLGFLERNKLNAHLKRKTLCGVVQPQPEAPLIQLQSIV